MVLVVTLDLIIKDTHNQSYLRQSHEGSNDPWIRTQRHRSPWAKPRGHIAYSDAATARLAVLYPVGERLTSTPPKWIPRPTSRSLVACSVCGHRDRSGVDATYGSTAAHVTAPCMPQREYGVRMTPSTTLPMVYRLCGGVPDPCPGSDPRPTHRSGAPHDPREGIQ
jgi:hypothetical protein